MIISQNKSGRKRIKNLLLHHGRLFSGLFLQPSLNVFRRDIGREKQENRFDQR